ncbi:MAG: glycerol-3-phosphate acyltransferase [candidate division WOR-3 bacterium]
MRLIFFGFITGYLLGSIPFAWIAVWLFKRIDMRNYGTRTVSATMVGVLISKPIAAVIGCLDILKGLIPVYFGKIFFESSSFFAYAAGIGALLGHNWPIWLRFQGGRGVSVVLGVLTVLFPFGVVYLLLMLGLGKLFRLGAIMVIIALSTMPGLAVLFHKPLPFIIFLLSVFLICLTKRIEANRESLPDVNKRAVILRRIFWDRDVPDYHYWLHRQL